MPTSIILCHLESSDAFVALCWKLLNPSEICKKIQVAESD